MMANKFFHFFSVSTYFSAAALFLFLGSVPAFSATKNSNWYSPKTEWKNVSSFHISAILDAAKDPAFAPQNLLDLICYYEGGKKKYDAVVGSATIKPKKNPTEMTFQEISVWTKKTPKQNHAIGCFQFIPKTLLRVKASLGISNRQIFKPSIQNKMATFLLKENGLDDWINGKISTSVFADNITKVWAAFPNRSGKSHYKGVGDNEALLARSEFIKQLNSVKTSS